MAEPARTTSTERSHAGPTEPFARVTAAAKALADPLRATVMRVLKDDSFGVLELCRVLDVPQPALSHHLKVLRGAGLVVQRREGNTIFYRRSPAPSRFHAALLAAIDEVALPEARVAGIDAVHAERSRQSEAFFAQHALDFATQQARISDAGVYAASVLETVDRQGLGDGIALEVGPGEGTLLSGLAERFRQVVGIDSAREMLDRAAERLAGRGNVRLLHRDIAGMPARPRYQLVLAAMVVHHQASPQRFFSSAARLLRRDGAMVVVELNRHDHEWTRTACGDVWLGFEPAELAGWAANAGLAPGESQYLAQKNGFGIQIHTYYHTSRRRSPHA